MKTIVAIGLTAGALAWATVFAVAQQFGTAAEARAMLDHAVTELKANETAALAKFNDKDNKQFHDRDLYVFCFMGADIRNLKVKDDPLGQRIFDDVKEGTVTTADYNFPKPGTSLAVPKQSYITRVSGQGCGVGYYK